MKFYDDIEFSFYSETEHPYLDTVEEGKYGSVDCCEHYCNKIGRYMPCIKLKVIHHDFWLKEEIREDTWLDEDYLFKFGSYKDLQVLKRYKK